MPESVIQRSFAGGELAPALHARADQAKYQSGLRTCRNFLVQRHGGVANRPGLRYIASCKTTSSNVQLMRYVSENPGESLLLECGTNYIRFFQNGAAVEVDPGGLDAWDSATNYVQGDIITHSGVTYYAKVDNTNQVPPNATYWHPFTGDILEIPTPFGSGQLPHWVQSGRTITLTHREVPPQELIFIELTRWILRPITTVATLPAPTGLAVTPGGGAGSRSFGYVVTAAAADTYEEGPKSAQVIVGGRVAPTKDAPHVLAWTPVPGAAEYYVYSDPYANGTYGFLGTATGAASFNDVGLEPDFTQTPPITETPFGAVDHYPHVAAYHQQRRFFASTVAEPDAVWASRVGFVSNFGISSPLQDDDALNFRIAGNDHNPVRHLVGLKTLVVLTDTGEWTVGAPKEPLTPSNIPADQETYVGVSDTRPVIVGNSIIYVQARGSVMRDLRFDQQVEGLAGRDLSIFAAHLFDGYTITEIDFAQTPHSIVWAIRADGLLLGMTYLREQEVWGWHRHDTAASGQFEHVCVIPEPVEDAVYLIVKRTIGGATKRYIERLESRRVAAATFDHDAFFVDAGLTYSGAPVSSVSGLGHLEGQVVAVVADGSVVFNGDPAAANAADFTVTAGAIALPTAASTIHAGLAIRYPELELLDLDVQGSAVRDKKKRVGSVSLLVEDSARTFRVGPSSSHLIPYALKPYETAADQFTGLLELSLDSTFGNEGRVFIRHTDPLPLTILGVIPNIAMGG